MRIIPFLLALCFTILPASATTIAFDGYTLSSDGQMTAGHSKIAMGAKIFYNPKRNKWLGGAGDVRTLQKIFAWFKSDEHDLPKIEGEFEVIIVNADGEVTVFLGNMEEGVNLGHTMFAMGSGGDYAMGAMAAGKNSKQAIEIASTLDIYTSNQITTFVVRKK